MLAHYPLQSNLIGYDYSSIYRCLLHDLTLKFGSYQELQLFINLFANPAVTDFHLIMYFWSLWCSGKKLWKQHWHHYHHLSPHGEYVSKQWLIYTSRNVVTHLESCFWSPCEWKSNSRPLAGGNSVRVTQNIKVAGLQLFCFGSSDSSQVIMQFLIMKPYLL